MRIDLVLANEPVADPRADRVGRSGRPQGQGPSDHAPVIVDLDRGAGRGHRAGRAAALGAGHPPRRQEAAAGALALAIRVPGGLDALRLARHLTSSPHFRKLRANTRQYRSFGG